ncbi:hypothetical protein N7519_007113 [Penicillium mononematosum]|uniref:uncharacterized protein n=1 Tax=Penicillium mononematosum TaxID=268346 RepID=UPI0025481B2C|nr:uncharacterized protein N7519_007113 [Penicillium mononematosum]KAJ6185812.1 hypothetical protein N7519_007113 [Penicillium mononematosum]
MSAHYFDSFTSASQFTGSNVKHISRLSMTSASGWGRKHLLACRVVVRQARHNILPILSPYSKSSDTTSPVEIVKFVNGPDHIQHFERSEHSLVRDFGYSISLAQTWAALAAFKGSRDSQRTQQSIGPSNSDDGNHSEDSNADYDSLMDTESDGDGNSGGMGRPAREIRPSRDSEFVHSGEMQVGSSSPQAASSQDASSTGHIDNAEHHLRGTVEDDTLRLLSCVIRHILYFGSPQDWKNMSRVVEFRDVKLQASAHLPSINKSINAIDDGGLCLRIQDEGSFTLLDDRVAILEAKRDFDSLEEGKPIISDRCLAQMTCEALVARSVSSEPRERVIVIHATQNYICFLEFKISDEYIQDLGSESPSSCITVVATPWYDLSSASNRKQVVLNLCALMRWGGARK